MNRKYNKSTACKWFITMGYYVELHRINEEIRTVLEHYEQPDHEYDLKCDPF